MGSEAIRRELQSHQDFLEQTLEDHQVKTARGLAQIEHGFDGLYHQTAKVWLKLESVTKRADEGDAKIRTMDKRFDAVDKRIDRIDRRLGVIHRRLEDLHERFGRSQREAMNASRCRAWEPITPVGRYNTDGHYVYPGLIPGTVRQFWLLKSPPYGTLAVSPRWAVNANDVSRTADELFELAEFYQIEHFQDWTLDDVLVEGELSPLSKTEIPRTLREATYMYPSLAHRAVAGALGLPYDEIKRQMERLEDNIPRNIPRVVTPTDRTISAVWSSPRELPDRTSTIPDRPPTSTERGVSGIWSSPSRDSPSRAVSTRQSNRTSTDTSEDGQSLKPGGQIAQVAHAAHPMLSLHEERERPHPPKLALRDEHDRITPANLSLHDSRERNGNGNALRRVGSNDTTTTTQSRSKMDWIQALMDRN
ncbi:MAG: hypothetical protein M1819_001620 [Sarea resinae]|nr:MAG: hypothetical protein M1819_001620 [Sarea resinae]